MPALSSSSVQRSRPKGDSIVVGSWGAAYLLAFNGKAWVQTEKLVPADLPPDALEYGISTAMSDGRVLVGAPRR